MLLCFFLRAEESKTAEKKLIACPAIPKTEGNRRFPRFPVLSLSPCGERFREGQEPSLGKEGRVVVKNPFLRRRGSYVPYLASGIAAYSCLRKRHYFYEKSLLSHSKNFIPLGLSGFNTCAVIETPIGFPGSSCQAK